MPIKHHWRVSPPPVGKYRSFESRQWPTAQYLDGRACAMLVCDDAYRPELARTGKHKPLTLRIANHAVTPWQWVRAKQQFATIDEAKQALKTIFEKAPSLAPKDLRP